MPNVVTLEQIATVCGVSRASVSFALRGRQGVSKTLRARIMATAKEMGYRPNPLVAAHMTHVRSHHGSPYQATVALLQFTGNDPENHRKALNRLHRAGATERTKQLGYNLEAFNLSSGQEVNAALARILSHRGIHGILIGALDTVEAQLDFKWDDFSTVAIGYSLVDPVLHRASYDNYNGMSTIVHELLAAGYQRLALTIDMTSDQRSHHYSLANFAAWQKTSKTKRPVPVLVIPQTDETAFRKWFERHRPDAIISLNPHIPTWLDRLGVRVPEDVGLATTYLQPRDKRAGMFQCPEDVAAAAVDLLVAELLGNSRGVPERPKLVFVPGRWQAGSTVCRASQTPA